MPSRHRDTVSYWVGLTFAGAFWLFAAYVIAFMLSMSHAGRMDGGTWVNALVSAYALVWMGAVTAYLLTMWSARDLASDVPVWRLSRSARPSDGPGRRVWFWARVAWWGWWAIVAYLGLFAGLLGTGIL